MSFLDFEELMNQAEQAGIPLNKVNEWYRTQKANPALKGKSPKDIVGQMQSRYDKALAMKKGGQVRRPKPKGYVTKNIPGYADGGNVLDPVEVTGRAIPDPLAVPQSYQAPNAPPTKEAIEASMRQMLAAEAAAKASYRPEELRAAQEQYAKKAGRPGLSAGLMAAGFGGLDVAKYQDDAVEKANKLLREKTIGAVEGRQKYATEGLKNFRSGVETAGLVVDQMDKSGRFDIDAKKAALDQRKLQLDLISNTAVTKELMDPTTPNSLAARNAARATLMKTGMFTKEQILKMVPNDMTGIEAAPVAALSGQSIENLLKVGQTTQAHGQAAQAYGLAEQARAQAGKTKEETRGATIAHDVFDEATKAPGGGRRVPPGMNLGVQSSGLELRPSPLTTGQQTSGAEAAARDQAQSTIASNTNLDALSGNLLKSAETARYAGSRGGTGLNAPILANLTPSQAEEMKNRIDQVISAKMQYDNAAGVNTIKDKDGEIYRILRLSNGAFQSEMARLNEQVARQQAMVQARQKHLEQYGTPAGFNPASIARKTYMVNPRTGQSVFDDLTPEQIKDARASGYKTSDEFGKLQK